jgi:hypothetical protein
MIDEKKTMSAIEEFEQALEQLRAIIIDYCEEDDIRGGKTEAKRAIAHLRDPGDIDKLSEVSTFLCWDALGMCDERTTFLEMFYQHFGLFFWSDAINKSKKEIRRDYSKTGFTGGKDSRR